MKDCTPPPPTFALAEPTAVSSGERIRAYERADVAARRSHHRVLALFVLLVLLWVACCAFGEIDGWTPALVVGAVAGVMASAVVFHLADFARLDARRATRLVELARREAGASASVSAAPAPWGRAA